MIKHFMRTAVLLVMLAPAAHADEFADEVKELLDLSHSLEPSVKLMDQMFRSMTPLLKTQLSTSLKQQGKSYHEEDLDNFLDDFRVRAVARFSEKLVPAITEQYRLHFTLDELQQLTELMKTPVFQAYASKIPAVMESLQTKGQKLGQEVAMEVVGEMMKDYPMFQ
ncbi:MAG: DUF2059 domain-containing protein [Alphaproteobacteria bacterium]|nr:MAG: DUF2059 domain-containing protein [Alphaproteobacteria bacterium]